MSRMTYFHSYFDHLYSFSVMPPFTAVNTMAGALLIGAICTLVLWSLIWKGVALWHSARNHQKAWFVVLLIVNTAGILEIIYFLFFRKNKNNVVTTTTVTHTTVAATPAAPVSAASADTTVMTPAAPAE